MQVFLLSDHVVFEVFFLFVLILRLVVVVKLILDEVFIVEGDLVVCILVGSGVIDRGVDKNLVVAQKLTLHVADVMACMGSRLHQIIVQVVALELLHCGLALGDDDGL